VSLTFLPIIIMAPICGALTLAVGIYFYVATYKEFKRISDLNQDDLDFSHIKLACTQEIIIRHEAVNINNNDNHAALKPFIKPFDFKNENRLRRFSSAVSTTLLTGGVLFATCYLTAAVILSTLAVTSVLLGPIGLCVAAGAALLIGAYAGYKQYQSLYNNEKLTAYKKHLDEQLLKKCKKCDELRGVRRPKKLYVRSLSDTDLAGERKAHLDPYFESTVLTQRRNFLDKRPVVATLAPEPDLHKSTRNKL